jgi:hypothetical protein
LLQFQTTSTHTRLARLRRNTPNMGRAIKHGEEKTLDTVNFPSRKPKFMVPPPPKRCRYIVLVDQVRRRPSVWRTQGKSFHLKSRVSLASPVCNVKLGGSILLPFLGSCWMVRVCWDRDDSKPFILFASDHPCSSDPVAIHLQPLFLASKHSQRV